MSQLDLALDAEVSARHISFLETGRAEPSREMLLMLSNVLDIPLRERNFLLLAAGYAPVYGETSLDDPRMTQVRAAVEVILKSNEPRSALAHNRHWDIVMANEAFIRFLTMTLGKEPEGLTPLTVTKAPRINMLRLLFDPNGSRKSHRELGGDRKVATERGLSPTGMGARRHFEKSHYGDPRLPRCSGAMA